MIILNDFRRQWDAIRPEAMAAMERLGASGWYILGQEVVNFEKALAAFWPIPHVIGVGNGMDAIEIALRCLGLKPGQKVLTTPLSAFATTLAIMRVGAIPVFVDVDHLGQIDLNQCRQVLQRDRAIRFLLPVHLYGMVTDLNQLAQLRNEFDLMLVEDCAQSIGAKMGDTRAGTVGQMAATSFYPTKNLGAMGDGGAVITADAALAERARVIRNYGQSATYSHSEYGLNSRLDELHAAILHDAFLPRLAAWTARRCAVAEQYLTSLTSPHLRLPFPAHHVQPAWHLFPVRVEAPHREGFRLALKDAHILTGVHYPRIIPDQQALKENGEFELAFTPINAQEIANTEVSLPIHPFLTDDEVKQIVEACNQWKP